MKNTSAVRKKRTKSGAGTAARIIRVCVAVVVVVAVILVIRALSAGGDVLLLAYEPENEAASISKSFQMDSQLFAQDLVVITDSSEPADPMDVGAALIFNLTDDLVVYSQSAFDRLYPASITKIMTYLVVREYGDLSREITVTDAMLNLESGSSVAGLKAGDVFKEEDLLYGMLMVSGNDAAQALALSVGGTLEGFADLMNEKAKELGATGTHFVNPHGLTDEQHYTTAYDIYLILNEALKDDLFVQILSAKEYTAYYTSAGGSQVNLTWEAVNQYLSGDVAAPEGITVIGGKTGTTQAAGYCMALYSKDDAGKEYISIILKDGSRSGLYEDLNELFGKIS